MLQVPGIVDLRVHQVANEPALEVDVDRTRAAQAGLTQRDVANNLLISLSGSSQTSPTFWLNPETGISYNVTTQTPQYRMDSLQDLGTIPVGAADGASRRRCWRAWPAFIARPGRRWCRTTTCSR